MTIKRCGSCIHWRDALTGWCDYYSWPMDADDTESCKAYEPIAYSENYVPVMGHELIELENELRREDEGHDTKKDWDNLIKPVLLDALEALETVSWSEISQYSNKRDAQMRIKAKRNIRKLIAELEGQGEVANE